MPCLGKAPFPTICTRLIGKSSLTLACGELSHGCAVESGCFANHFDLIRGDRSPRREFLYVMAIATRSIDNDSQLGYDGVISR